MKKEKKNKQTKKKINKNLATATEYASVLYLSKLNNLSLNCQCLSKFTAYAYTSMLK